MIGKSLTILDEIDSSNNYAMSEAMRGTAKHGAAFMALHQTAGKGQRGKQWNDETGKNIALSILLDMSGTPVNTQFLLNTAVALAAYDLFKKYALDETKIKWSNDIYWRDRKAVGILIENKFIGQNWQWAIAGIGMNINQTSFDESLGKKVVSLKQITGKEFDIVELAKELCAFLDKRFEQFKAKKFDELLEEYNENLFRKNEATRLKYDGQTFEAIIRHADEQGNLRIDGAPKPFFTFGEIEWLIV
ncbi:biotin--[acetyl-CoA-carboxylase] ligase [Arachidicoccus ginsenosidimutans]|uniref:biotin--[acetyl-CoA-carboxylase] ligase n=1 Tax=Arachidicoccus sp. BS20 TaxID=1850526 RepID=UPI0007F16E59|nr:biotin--[acetyl-CoA-carboxylase] ligase [Arachidicoccus sp. BS20]ANI88758.1 biotin--[acetyl-CoA-carboxylase] ligase [Arachidicoccus sp. BS20]